MAIVDLNKKIGKNDTENGNTLHLTTPDGEDIGVSLIIRSMLSKEAKQVIRKQNEVMTKKSRRGKKETLEEVEKSNAELVKVLIVNGDKFKIGKVEIDPSAMTMETTSLLITEYPFIMQQIIDFASDDTNFYGDTEGN